MKPKLIIDGAKVRRIQPPRPSFLTARNLFGLALLLAVAALLARLVAGGV